MSGQYLSLEFLHVFIPELSRLTIEWARTVNARVSYTVQRLEEKKRRVWLAHLFGSPNKLCKLNNTVPVLSTALHLSFKISRQILPFMSTLG